MKRIFFADTWFLIAAIDRFDTHFDAVRRIRAKLLGGSRLVTHTGVLSELLAHFSDEGPHARKLAALAVREAFRGQEVIPADRDLFLRALELYERRPDKEYSLVDCMSMTVMRERGIADVLTNDHHFQQEGFTVVNDAA